MGWILSGITLIVIIGILFLLWQQGKFRRSAAAPPSGTQPPSLTRAWRGEWQKTALTGILLVALAFVLFPTESQKLLKSPLIPGNWKVVKKTTAVRAAPAIARKLIPTGITLAPGDRMIGSAEGTPIVVFRLADGEQRELPRSCWSNDRLEYTHIGRTLNNRTAEVFYRGGKEVKLVKLNRADSAPVALAAYRTDTFTNINRAPTAATQIDSTPIAPAAYRTQQVLSQAQAPTAATQQYGFSGETIEVPPMNQ